MEGAKILRISQGRRLGGFYVDDDVIGGGGGVGGGVGGEVVEDDVCFRWSVGWIRRKRYVEFLFTLDVVGADSFAELFRDVTDDGVVDYVASEVRAAREVDLECPGPVDDRCCWTDCAVDVLDMFPA